MRQAKVLISIVNWNGGGTVRACIEQLLRSDFRSFSVIIIDNASSDDSLDGIEQKNPAIEVIRNDENRGFAGGHNQGLRIAAERGFEYYWMINSDLAVDPDTLQELVAAIESDARIAMVSPVIEDASVEGKIQFCGGSIDWEQMSFRNWESVELAVVAQRDSPATFFLWGTALLLRLSAMAKIGEVDERFFAYYEDVDLSVRAVRCGFENRVVPAARVRHWGQNDGRLRSSNYVYYNARNRALFWSKHLPRRRLFRFWRLYSAAALVTASGFRESNDTEKAKAALAGAVDAFVRRGGIASPTRANPAWLEKLAFSCPYALANILRGNLAVALRRLLGWRRGVR